MDALCYTNCDYTGRMYFKNVINDALNVIIVFENLTRVWWFPYILQIHTQLNATPFAVTRCSSRSRFLIFSLISLFFRQLRVEGVTKAVLCLLNLEDLAAVTVGVSPPTTREEIRTLRYRFQKYSRHVDIYSKMT